LSQLIFKQHWFQQISLLFSILAILLTSCTPAAVKPTQTATIPTQPVTATKAAPTKVSQAKPSAVTPEEKQAIFSETVLQNLLYKLPDLGEVQLKDGHFEEKYGEGITQVNQVGFLQSAQGDLNGDKVADAVVILWANTGGSGLYSYIVAVINQGGKVQPTNAELLGDRVKIEGLQIKDGQIELQTLEPGPKDPQCCPSQLVARTMKVEGTLLKVISEDRHGEAASALTDIIWQWERYQEKDNANNIEVNAPGKYTLTLLADGLYQVTADCITASGTYTVSGTTIKLEPGETTLIACPEGSLSTKYLNLLNEVVTVVFINGQLVLENQAGSGMMIFSTSG
jgi:heat shock protein HslJ